MPLNVEDPRYPTTTSAILAVFRSRDDVAAKIVMDYLRRRARSVCRRFSWHDYEDVASFAFQRMMSDYEPAYASFRAWSKRVIENHLIDLSKRKRPERLDEAALGRLAAPDDGDFDREALALAVAFARAAVRPEEWRAFELAHLDRECVEGVEVYHYHDEEVRGEGVNRAAAELGWKRARVYAAVYKVRAVFEPYRDLLCS